MIIYQNKQKIITVGTIQQNDMPVHDLETRSEYSKNNLKNYFALPYHKFNKQTG